MKVMTWVFGIIIVLALVQPAKAIPEILVNWQNGMYGAALGIVEAKLVFSAIVIYVTNRIAKNY